ncbi:MAG: hypothetical protein PHF35_00865 [Candidatus Moranbacteria bacterium]|nr:hypothetical protein [Candidatus Moranbacteria bacterium]
MKPKRKNRLFFFTLATIGCVVGACLIWCDLGQKTSLQEQVIGDVPEGVQVHPYQMCGKQEEYQCPLSSNQMQNVGSLDNLKKIAEKKPIYLMVCVRPENKKVTLRYVTVDGCSAYSVDQSLNKEFDSSCGFGWKYKVDNGKLVAQSINCHYLAVAGVVIILLASMTIIIPVNLRGA